MLRLAQQGDSLEESMMMGAANGRWQEWHIHVMAQPSWGVIVVVTWPRAVRMAARASSAASSRKTGTLYPAPGRYSIHLTHSSSAVNRADPARCTR